MQIARVYMQLHPSFKLFLTYLVANDLRWEYESIAFKKQETYRQKPNVGFLLFYTLQRGRPKPKPLQFIFLLELYSAKQQLLFDFSITEV